MSPDKIQALKESFPRLFRGRGQDFACSDGWYDLIRGACAFMQAQAAALKLTGDEYPLVLQIKEKFGTLRFYVQGPVEIQRLSDQAEFLSQYICERCGTTEGVECKERDEPHGWILTLCQACRDADNQERVALKKSKENPLQ